MSNWGKVFENNHFIQHWNENIKNYDYTLKNKSTFDKSNRCTLEISQEQYEKLLESIKEDIEKTSKRTPILMQNDSKNDKS